MRHQERPAGMENTEIEQKIGNLKTGNQGREIHLCICLKCGEVYLQERVEPVTCIV